MTQKKIKKSGALDGSTGNVGRHSRWVLDVDYTKSLNPQERRWLSQFLEEYYLSSSKAKILSSQELRARWKAYKANQRDLAARELGRISSHSGEYSEQFQDLGRVEDDMIEALDAKRTHGRLTARVRPRPVTVKPKPRF